jgi:hypothetical protein
MNVIPARGPSRPRLRSVRSAGATLAAAALLAGSLATAPAAVASPLVTGYSDPPGFTVTEASPLGDGSQASPFTYNVAINCSALLPTMFPGIATFARAELDKYYRLVVTVASSPANNCGWQFDTNRSQSTNIHPVTANSTEDETIQFTSAVNTWGFRLLVDDGTNSSAQTIEIFRPMSPPPPPGGGGGGGVAPDPTAAAVATAVAQSTAAGVEGTSAAVMVRNGQVVPVTSTLTSGAGPRGGVVLETEGLKVTVASEVGARAGSGVVVPSGGEMECSLCGAFAPGSVVEAWVNSDPRLTAAVLIPEDAEDGDCHVLAIPTGAPLDGGGAIEEGAHTLQLRMYTDSGFAVLSTGITVGSVSPSRIPAGEGSAPLSGPLGAALILLVGAGGLGLVAARREAVRG